MPSIIPGYVYSLFAALLVGVIVVYSCSVSTLTIRTQATNQQMKNIDDYVATECINLLSHTIFENQNTTKFLDVPSQVGNQIFWVQICTDSSGSWVESGFGRVVSSSPLHTAIPLSVNASGIFISGSGRAMLQCHYENQTATLTLTSE
jgi:hypothetical protein